MSYVLLSRRKTLSIAGQLVAVREDGVTTQVYVDHLGSTAALGNAGTRFYTGHQGISQAIGTVAAIIQG